MLITNNLNTYEKDVILLSIYNFYHLIFILIIHDHTWFVLIFLNLYFIKIKKKSVEIKFYLCHYSAND